MKKTILLLALVTLPLLLVAQTQQGVTYRYNGKQKRTPLGQVSISYDGNKRTVLSDAKDGTFTLVLDGRKMGDRIGLVTVKKREMMVFNQHAVDEWSVRKEPLMLILCNADEFEQQKNNYIEIGKRQAKKKYDQQKAELEAQLREGKVKQQEYEAALDKAYEELDRLQKNIGEYADLLARIDQSELDGQMQEVLDLYERGQVDEAMSRLDAMQLGKLLDKTLQKKSFHEQGLEETTQDSVLLVSKIKSAVNLYQNCGEYEKAGENLKLLADRLNTADDCWAYANFCSKQNQFTEAEIYNQRSLALLESQSDHESTNYQSQYSSLLNNLAWIYFMTQRFIDAETMYKEALDIRQQLCQSDSLTFKPYVVTTMSYLAILYHNTQRIVEAEAMYKEVIERYRCLIQHGSQTYEPDMAQAINNLAILYQNTNRNVEAEKMYKEALDIKRRYAQINQETYSPDVALTLCNLGVLYNDTHRYAEAEEMHKEALEIRRHLAQSNPQAYEPYLAMSFQNLANLYSNTNRYSEAEIMYKDALEIYKRLAQLNPQAYYFYTTKPLNGLADLYSKTNRFSEAEMMFKKALEILRRLAQSNPKAYEPEVAMSLFNLAVLYQDTQRFAESEPMYKESLEMYRRLAQSNHQVYEPDVASALNNLATLYYRIQRFAEAEPLHKEALEIYLRLAQSNPQVYEPDVAQTQGKLGALKLNMEQYSDAIPYFEGALEIFKRGGTVNPAFQTQYEGSLYCLSLLYSETKNYPAAYAINQELLPIMKGMYEENPDGLKSDYAGRLGNQSFYAIFMRQYQKSEQYAREAITIDSSKHWIQANLAAALLFQGKYGEAEAIYRQYKDELKNDFLGDFKQFAEAGVIPKEREEDVERIKKILEE